MGSFQIIHIPDMQRQPAACSLAQTQWVVDHMTSNNIAFVVFTGDLVEDLSVDAGWISACASVNKLSGIVPFATIPGNHDLYIYGSFSPGNYLARFPITNYAGLSWFGGASADSMSSYQLFTAGGVNFLHLALKYGPEAATISWAAGILAANPTRKVILSTHSYLNINGTYTAQGAPIKAGLVDVYSNVFLVLCGHMHGVCHNSRTVNGFQVDELLADFQADENGVEYTDGGRGFMRAITIST
jgi:predicted MPP superfamily phosphohydrolase